MKALRHSLRCFVLACAIWTVRQLTPGPGRRPRPGSSCWTSCRPRPATPFYCWRRSVRLLINSLRRPLPPWPPTPLHIVFGQTPPHRSGRCCGARGCRWDPSLGPPRERRACSTPRLRRRSSPWRSRDDATTRVGEGRGAAMGKRRVAMVAQDTRWGNHQAFGRLKVWRSQSTERSDMRFRVRARVIKNLRLVPTIFRLSRKDCERLSEQWKNKCSRNIEGRNMNIEINIEFCPFRSFFDWHVGGRVAGMQQWWTHIGVSFYVFHMMKRFFNEHVENQ